MNNIHNQSFSLSPSPFPNSVIIIIFLPYNKKTLLKRQREHYFHMQEVYVYQAKIAEKLVSTNTCGKANPKNQEKQW